VYPVSQCRLLEGPALFARRLHVANSFPLPFPETASGLVERRRSEPVVLRAMPASLPPPLRVERCASVRLQPTSDNIDDLHSVKVNEGVI